MSALTSSQLIALLQKNKISTPKELAEIDDYSKTNKITFAEALVQRDIITDDALGDLLAQYYQLPLVKLAKLVITPDAFNSIPFSQSEKYKIVVFARDAKVIKITTCAPPVYPEILQNITKKTGLKIELYYSTDTDIDNFLVNNRQDLQSTFDKLLKEGMVTATNVDGSDDPPVEKR